MGSLASSSGQVPGPWSRKHLSVYCPSRPRDRAAEEPKNREEPVSASWSHGDQTGQVKTNGPRAPKAPGQAAKSPSCFLCLGMQSRGPRHGVYSQLGGHTCPVCWAFGKGVEQEVGLTAAERGPQGT